MEQIIKIFGPIYPYSLILLIVLVAYRYTLKRKIKKTIFIDLFIYLAIIIYFISFFSNYKMQFFMILWLIRDFVFFVIISKLWQLYSNYKTSVIIGFFLIVLAIGFLYYKNGAISFTKAAPVGFDFDKNAELLFEIKNKQQLPQVKELLKRYNPLISIAFPQLTDTLITDLDYCYSIDVKDTSILNSLKDTLEKSGLVSWVENNETVYLSPVEKAMQDSVISTGVFSSKSLNDEYLSKLWGFKYMDIDNLITALKKRKPVKKARIFILDTGIDSKHEDLSDNYISLSDKYDTDTDQHGTHCAGIACAVSNNKKGIASFNFTGDFTSITSITVLPGGSGTQESIIDGIILAADNGADVISMSLGGLSSDLRQRAYESAIKYANDKGAIVVVAAGNENTNAKNVVPASCKGVIAVSAVDENLQKANFSNYVSDLQYKVSAPGVNIYSTIPLNQYKSMNGTSMATPYVAGLIGIMKSIEPDLTTEDVYRSLISSGIDTKNNEQTGKFIQPLKSILDLKTTSTKTRFKVFLNDLLTLKE